VIVTDKKSLYFAFYLILKFEPMKRILLSLACCISTTGVFAQQIQNVTLQQATPSGLTAKQFDMPDLHLNKVSADKMRRFLHSPAPFRKLHTHDTRKTTSLTTYNDWYDLWDQNMVPGVTAEYYMPIAPDSNMIDDNFGGTDHIAVHGIGMSFDPTDSGYAAFPDGYAAAYGVSKAMPPTNQPYMIDSFYVPIVYLRNNPSTSVVDSVVIEIVVSEVTPGVIDSGAYNASFLYGIGGFLPVTYDGTPRFSAPRYNPGLTAPYNVSPYINDCYFDSVFTRKYRYVLPLDNITWHDTAANGCLNLNRAAHLPLLPLSPAITVSSSDTHVTSYVSFKSGVAYPLGTLTSSANVIYCFAGEPFGSTRFMQSASNPSLTPAYPGSYQSALYATNAIRYSETGLTIGTLAHDVLVPGVALTNPGLSVTLDAWHVNWSCNTPTVSAITGGSTVCEGASITLLDATTGGSWSTVSGNASVSGGIVTGIFAGVDTVVYTVTNSCGSARAFKIVTVNPRAVPGTIIGSSNVCIGTPLTLTDFTTGGTWSASNANATVSGGIVTGVTPGTDIISYTVSNSCGPVSATKVVTINAPVTAGSIGGPTAVCIGSFITLSDAVTGGNWTSGTGKTTEAGGVTTGLTAGAETISYTVPGSGACPNATTIYGITVNPLPTPIVTASGLTLSTTPSYITYQWNYGGTALTGATSSTYEVLLDGNYTVTVVDANGCSGTSSIIPILYVGVKNINALYPVKVYPNPSQSVVNIESFVKVNVRLTTIDGRLVQYVRDAKQLDISGLPEGNYLLTIYEAATDLKIKTERLVKSAQ
jgi:hypothetical protein